MIEPNERKWKKTFASVFYCFQVTCQIKKNAKEKPDDDDDDNNNNNNNRIQRRNLRFFFTISSLRSELSQHTFKWPGCSRV